MQPDHRALLAGVPEWLELVVPGLPEGEPQLLVQLQRVDAADLHRVPDAVLGDHHVAGRIGLRVEDAEVGGVHPAGTVGAVAGVLTDLVAEVLPAPQRGCDGSTGTLRTLPEEVGPQGVLHHGLLDPREVDGAPECATRRPFDMGAERARRGVHIEHTPSEWCSHGSFSVRLGTSSPTTW